MQDQEFFDDIRIKHEPIAILTIFISDVFRGCYKGEYGVNPHQLNCTKQADSIYCFCEGDQCNNEETHEYTYYNDAYASDNSYGDDNSYVKVKPYKGYNDLSYN